jgi:hypothetical protein
MNPILILIVAVVGYLIYQGGVSWGTTTSDPTLPYDPTYVPPDPTLATDSNTPSLLDSIGLPSFSSILSDLTGVNVMPAQTDIATLVTETAVSLGLDPALALAQAQQESRLNPNAVSSAGARGVMQLMPATAAWLGVSDSFDPVSNITAGLTYFKNLLGMFSGDTAAALAAYNWGQGNVQKAMAKYGPNWLAHAPAETQNYVRIIYG